MLINPRITNPPVLSGSRVPTKYLLDVDITLKTPIVYVVQFTSRVQTRAKPIINMLTMAPIRLAIIGLSSSAVTSWAKSAHLPYLLSARGRSKYNIVAICNSSIESAKSAIKLYGLDVENTRAYGDPATLAADPNVDLVVCCTRVDTHYAVVKPSVEAGKAVFVEWPLTHDVQLSRELADLAAEKKLRTMVGLQGRLTPVVLRIKEIVQEQSLGKVLSSDVRAHGGTNDRETMASGLSYFTDRKIGGNVFMIGFAHCKCWKAVSGVFLDVSTNISQCSTMCRSPWAKPSTCILTYSFNAPRSSSATLLPTIFSVQLSPTFRI